MTFLPLLSLASLLGDHHEAEIVFAGDAMQHQSQLDDVRRPDGSYDYALGNFISGMRTVDTRGGAMVKVKLHRDSAGRAVVDDASYRLVYTVPPGMDKDRSGYHLVYPSDSVPDSHCRLFEQSAEAIFRKHNRGVPRK